MISMKFQDTRPILPSSNSRLKSLPIHDKSKLKTKSVENSLFPIFKFNNVLISLALLAAVDFLALK